MLSTVERIRQEASQLPYDEREALVRMLEIDLDSTAAAGADPAEVEAAWDEEIAARVRDVEEGRVELVSADESLQRIRARLAERRSGRAPAP
jgi:hypothetical protein